MGNSPSASATELPRAVSRTRGRKPVFSVKALLSMAVSTGPLTEANRFEAIGRYQRRVVARREELRAAGVGVDPVDLSDGRGNNPFIMPGDPEYPAPVVRENVQAALGNAALLAPEEELATVST